MARHGGWPKRPAHVSFTHAAGSPRPRARHRGVWSFAPGRCERTDGRAFVRGRGLAARAVVRRTGRITCGHLGAVGECRKSKGSVLRNAISSRRVIPSRRADRRRGWGGGPHGTPELPRVARSLPGNRGDRPDAALPGRTV